jgi:putative DNA primase/helicase
MTKAKTPNAGTSTLILPSPNAPLEVARELLAARYVSPTSDLTLRHYRGTYWRWTGPKWVEVESRAVRADAYHFTEHAEYLAEKGYKAWEPNRNKITSLLDALAALVHLPEGEPMPSWLDGRLYDGRVVAVANGLLDVSQRKLLGHTPAFFNSTAVPFDYDPEAPPPTHWLRFLHDLWPDDLDSINALAEWFGYIISGRLDLHKILLLCGPTRAGKGVTARTLSKLVGIENTCGPTLSSLATNFGLQPLLGKTLAVVSDARLNGYGAHVVVERLLSISGEDALTVDRKYRDQWTGKLPARLMLCSNELPQLGDASMAVAVSTITEIPQV